MADRPGKRIARKCSADPPKDSTLGAIPRGSSQETFLDGLGQGLAETTYNTVPSGPNMGTFLDRLGEELSRAEMDRPHGTIPASPNQVSESSRETTKLLESITQPRKEKR